ncbi:unnamed protein product [Aspergillus oryzae RIB40]|uniref:DNA, SC138 n=1 Tax=Aspergillus oryzae (strain ATCC 42149 / RIB 40) TaxID=510516 RepID=Q2U204_ASPOR|nr:unnamed protein product [Aspergillus oryzae RIB40]BAE64411.1 unnamed protein product [Aspergillus oryzae RIB40]
MADIIRLFMAQIRQHLTASDLAKLARVSHELNDLATPYLYQTVHFHSPGRIKPDDQLLSQLDILGNLHFNKLVYTRRVVVSGSCWDMQVSLTQVLLTTVLLQQRLRCLRIRMGTDCTPKPFFRPTLHLHTTVKLRVMHLTQVDTVVVLQSLGVALKHATQLERLSIWADDRAELSISSLVEDWHKPAPFRLRSLDIRGFSDIGIPAKSMWAAIPPTELRELTLELGPSLLVQDLTEFWDASVEADLRPLRLRVNLGIKGIQEFISSFSGLEAFHLVPSDTLRPMEPIRVLVDALRRHHSSTLKVLGLSPFLDGSKYVLDVPDIKYLVGALPDIEELRTSSFIFYEKAMPGILPMWPLTIPPCAKSAEIRYGFPTESLVLDMSVARSY